jgi:pimeloyl-ACP methyl ester carboxylesterase
MNFGKWKVSCFDNFYYSRKNLVLSMLGTSLLLGLFFSFIPKVFAFDNITGNETSVISAINWGFVPNRLSVGVKLIAPRPETFDIVEMAFFIDSLAPETPEDDIVIKVYTASGSSLGSLLATSKTVSHSDLGFCDPVGGSTGNGNTIACALHTFFLDNSVNFDGTNDYYIIATRSAGAQTYPEAYAMAQTRYDGKSLTVASNDGSSFCVDYCNGSSITSGWLRTSTTENCFDGLQNQDETGIDVGGICLYITGPKYSNLYFDTSQRISSSYNRLIQTLGTNLAGILTKIEIKTSNPGARLYGDKPTFKLYECDNDTYGSPTLDGLNCNLLYSGISNDNMLFEPSIQSFYTNPINFNPLKYYFFSTQGINSLDTLPFYYGSIEDTVEGACYQYTSSGTLIPCATVSDLYFNFYGISKSETPPPECIADCFSNVLFLPGFEASRLYTTRADDSQDQLWEPNGNSDVEDLYLNADGTSKNSGIYTEDIIKEAPAILGPAGQNIYKSFSGMMDQLVADGKIKEWQPYAYDWRQSVDDIIDNGTNYKEGKKSLIETLQKLVSTSKSGKVTIVAHSNGGLLAKALLAKLQEDKNAGVNDLIDHVDVLILVAVPEIGAASALPAILHGYDQRILLGLLLDESHARELGRNMISAFGLLPSQEYVNRVSASPVTFTDTVIPSGVTTSMVQTFGSAISSYSEYKDFLFGAEGRADPLITETKLPIKLSQTLFSNAENLHSGIDAWVPPENLRVIEVAGWGLDTLASFEYYPKSVCSGLNCSFVLDERPRFTSDGDGTVVVPSAQYMSLNGVQKYWVNLPIHNRELRRLRRNRQHKDILEVDELNDFITSVINQEEVVVNSVIENNEPLDTSNRLRISIHSPVTLDAYDNEGNHTGKVCPNTSNSCYAEENILNSSYLEFGEGKYINLPEEELARVILQGTDIGTFTYESAQVQPDDTTTVSSFIDIPVTTQTKGEIILNTDTQAPEFKLDINGDGRVEFTIAPSDEFSPILYLQIIKATVNSLDLPPSQKTAFGKRIDNIIKSIKDGKIDQAKIKAEKFSFGLENKLSKQDPKKPKPKKISKEDAQILLNMFNKLLDNLN